MIRGTRIGESRLKDLLEKITEGKGAIRLRKGQTIYFQGDRANAVFFIQSGRVKITAASPGGREAVLALRGADDFFGEGSLAGQSRRANTAAALEAAVILRVEKHAMLKAVHDEPELARKFLELLIIRNIKLEEDLCNLLFNHSERRLARVLLKLAESTQHGTPRQAKMPRLSHQTLAEMVGTTRPRITQFMNKFKRLGILDYDGELTVKPDLFGKVLRD